jgi:hypothetical protein
VPKSWGTTLATFSGYQTKFYVSRCFQESRTTVDVTYFFSSVSRLNIMTSNNNPFVHTRVKLWQSSQHLPHFSATLVHQGTVKPHWYDIALYGTFTLTIKSLLQLWFVQNMSSTKAFIYFWKLTIFELFTKRYRMLKRQTLLESLFFSWPQSLFCPQKLVKFMYQISKHVT